MVVLLDWIEARIETIRTLGSTNASSGSFNHGELSARNLPGTGEYGMAWICSSAQAHGGRRSGGFQASRQIASKMFTACVRRQNATTAGRRDV